MLRVKIIFCAIITFAICCKTHAQQSYQQWQKQQNERYESWSLSQDWNRQYFIWKAQADKEFESWKKQNGWEEDINSENFMNDNPLENANPLETKNTLDGVSNQYKQKEKQRRIKERMQLEKDQNPNNPYVKKQRENTLQDAHEQLEGQTKQSQNTNRLPSKPVSLREIKIWAVIVGVARYENPKSRLNYSDDDAYKIYGFLKSPEGGALPEDRIALLVDEDATGEGIKQSLQSFSDKAGSQDILLFYFSGHGVPNALLAEDFASNNTGVISHKFIKQQLENSRAKHTYCIVDACHSGTFSVKSSQGKNMILSSNQKNPSVLNLESSQAFYTTLQSQKKGSVSILSSKGKETSLEASGKRQGVFSYFLIRGLRGEADYNKDKIISVTELFDFTRKKVKSYTNDKQTPIITGDYSHAMPIAIVR